MAYRNDGGFGSGMGGGFGTSNGYDPHREWNGTTATRGVTRDGSRVPREHEDEHQAAPGPSMHREHGGFSNYAGGGNRDRSSQPHLSEYEARQVAQMQHGYGQSQYDYPAQQRWGHGASGTDMGFGEREPERGPHYGKGPKGYKRSDERIREEVCEVMSRQGFIDASDVEVSVEGGVVRLVGTVATRNDKRGLEMLTDRIHGVEEVRNEIRLRRETPMGQSPTSVRAAGPQSAKPTQS